MLENWCVRQNHQRTPYLSSTWASRSIRPPAIGAVHLDGLVGLNGSLGWLGWLEWFTWLAWLAWMAHLAGLVGLNGSLGWLGRLQWPTWLGWLDWSLDRHHWNCNYNMITLSYLMKLNPDNCFGNNCVSQMAWPEQRHFTRYVSKMNLLQVCWSQIIEISIEKLKNRNWPNQKQ